MLRRAFDAKFWAHLTAIQTVLPHLAADGSITLQRPAKVYLVVEGPLAIGASPAGALTAVRACAFTSARVGDEACAKAPCENTAMAAATAPRASLVFIG